MKIVLRVACCTVLALALVGCHDPASTSAGGRQTAQALDLKLYHVPAPKAAQATRALQDVFAVSNDVRVTQPFPGTIMVLAPDALQPSVGRAIDGVVKATGNSASDVPASVPINVRFWLVQAKAGDGAAAAALAPLQPTLKQIGASLGPSHFVLEDTAATLIDAPNHPGRSAGSGSVATARGHKFAFHATAIAQDEVALEIHFTTAANDSVRDLSTTVTVKSGNYVVLAEAQPAADSSGPADAGLMNLLVVRVDRADLAKH